MSSALAAGMLMLVVVAAGIMALKYRALFSFRYILFLTRCLVRSDVFSWPALHFTSQIMAASVV